MSEKLLTDAEMRDLQRKLRQLASHPKMKSWFNSAERQQLNDLARSIDSALIYPETDPIGRTTQARERALNRPREARMA